MRGRMSFVCGQSLDAVAHAYKTRGRASAAARADAPWKRPVQKSLKMLRGPYGGCAVIFDCWWAVFGNRAVIPRK
jgi:type IV secretory pathway VirB2 component (pilin)